MEDWFAIRCFMKNITLKTILSLVCCSLIIALILSGFAVTQSRNVMRNQVKKELMYASQKYANQFSTEFKTQESVVDLICTMVSATFDTEAYANDRERFLFLEKKLNEVIRDTMGNKPETQSLYFTFNPETSGANDEIWYLRNEKGKVYYMQADNTVSDWLIDDGSAESAYYFEAIKKGKHWSGVEYEKYLDTYSVTYSRACSDRDGRLIGVMGTDIFIQHIFNTVKHIQLEEGGYAFLTDKEFNYLAGSSSEDAFNAMKKEGILRQMSDAEPNASNLAQNGERYLTARAVTSNGWILTLVQREQTLLQPIHDMKRILFSMAALILIGVLAYSYYFFRKSLVPIVREFEQKDVIMRHQSRQAKLGEMVGNIAHQWKQPLNVMSISLSNLWDDYRHEKLTEEVLKSHIDDMRLYIKNMSGTVDDFADFLKPSRKKEEFLLEDAVRTALGLMQESIKMNRITVVVSAEHELASFGYRNEFCQGIFNILNNARDAIMEANPEKREIRIRIYTRAYTKPVAVIDIENEGNPIREADRTKLFEPYFTTKEETGGTGIGLYLTKEIVEAHMGGSIQLFNTENGVCCRILLPGRPAAGKSDAEEETEEVK